MDRQAPTGDTVLVKSRKMIGRSQTPPVVVGGRTGKDDGKQNRPLKLKEKERDFFGFRRRKARERLGPDCEKSEKASFEYCALYRRKNTTVYVHTSSMFASMSYIGIAKSCVVFYCRCSSQRL